MSKHSLENFRSRTAVAYAQGLKTEASEAQDLRSSGVMLVNQSISWRLSAFEPLGMPVCGQGPSQVGLFKNSRTFLIISHRFFRF